MNQAAEHGMWSGFFCRRSDPPVVAGDYFRHTAQGARVAASEAFENMSHYLRDVLLMCERGARMGELRQFMPLNSLHESLLALLELGLIECAEQRSLLKDGA
ncbi:MAG: hypothetical protein ACREXN_00675 [Polaromonas sp.]